MFLYLRHSGRKLEKFRVMVSKTFDPVQYSANQFHVCHQQTAALPTSSFRPLYCQQEVVGRYVVVEKTDSVGHPLNFCELEVYGTQHSGKNSSSTIWLTNAVEDPAHRILSCRDPRG